MNSTQAAVALAAAMVSSSARYSGVAAPSVMTSSIRATPGHLSGTVKALRTQDLERYTSNVLVRSTEVQKMGVTGKGVTIAVIDSGIDPSHPGLKGAIVDEACFCTRPDGSPCCPDGTSRQFGPGAAVDEIGHGTHVAGIIAGRGRKGPRGVAPGAHLISIKVAGEKDEPSVAAMIEALEWIADSRPEVRIVNMSLGTAATYQGNCDTRSADTASFAAVGRRLAERGTILVAAAGNGWTADKMTAPACVSGFLAVGAVHSLVETTPSAGGCPRQTSGADRIACFSNSSSSLAMLAPGVDVVSLYPGGRVALGSGTSQSAAAVSGAIALLMAGAPGAARQIVSAMGASGVPVTDERNGRVTPRVDAHAALLALRSSVE